MFGMTPMANQRKKLFIRKNPSGCDWCPPGGRESLHSRQDVETTKKQTIGAQGVWLDPSNLFSLLGLN
jgi:hypothetical protein